MASIRVFFCEPTGRTQRYLRRHAKGPCGEAPGFSYHNAKVPLDVVATEPSDSVSGDRWSHDDTRWPPNCEACGRPFEDDDDWQLFRRSIYRRPDTGEEFTLAEAPVGACWDATWFHDHPCWLGPDGRSLVVRTPGGGEWIIDSRASNCTMPDDDKHKCWVRHGRPEDGTLHVDKQGITCAAGAGSIQCGAYHGFLHHGHLNEC